MSRRFHALSDITARVGELLAPAFGKRFWVKAEISSGRERGHFYCDLVEIGERGDVSAQLRCTIWAADLARIRKAFERAGLELQLGNGTQIGIECELQWHPRYGLSLSGRDMDPAFALGELELRRRRRILETLEREGLLGLNARRPVPLLPNRIALITSPGSAAYEDFVQTLARSDYGFQILVAAASMQGPDTQRSVLAALDTCERLAVDLVVVARGGGSKTELSWLDDEALARRIAAHRHPVWTGIGHEIDVSVLDAVAGASWKTPTAVAEALVGRFVAVDRRLEQATLRLRSVWQLRHGVDRERVRRAGIGLRQGSRKLLDQRRSDLLRAAGSVRAEVIARLRHERNRLTESRTSLKTRVRESIRDHRGALVHALRALGVGSRSSLRLARERLVAQRARLSPRRVLARVSTERRRLVDIEQMLRAVDPSTALARGFSLTRDANGAIVRALAQVERGAKVTTQIADGSFESVVGETRRDGDG